MTKPFCRSCARLSTRSVSILMRLQTRCVLMLNRNYMGGREAGFWPSKASQINTIHQLKALAEES